jgi:hypothetical protein
MVIFCLSLFGCGGDDDDGGGADAPAAPDAPAAADAPSAIDAFVPGADASGPFTICDSPWTLADDQDCAECFGTQCCDQFKACSEQICVDCLTSNPDAPECATDTAWQDLSMCMPTCNAVCN